MGHYSLFPLFLTMGISSPALSAESYATTTRTIINNVSTEVKNDVAFPLSCVVRFKFKAQAGLPAGGVPFVDQAAPANTRSQYSLIVAGRNFGCGSSREHAPLALAEAGVRAVVAEFYARIFFRNSVNGGYLIPLESVERLVEAIRTGDEVEVRPGESCLVHCATGRKYRLKPLGDVAPIIEAGGIFEYAKQAGML